MTIHELRIPSFIKHNFMKCRCSGFLFALNSNILICGGQTHWIPNYHLVGGLKYFLCSSLFGEMIQFNYCNIFQIGLKPPASHQFCGPQNANDVFGSNDDRPFKMWPFAFTVWSNILVGDFNFFIFTPIWGRFPFWLIFFRWVETTN